MFTAYSLYIFINLRLQSFSQSAGEMQMIDPHALHVKEQMEDAIFSYLFFLLSESEYHHSLGILRGARPFLIRIKNFL